MDEHVFITDFLKRQLKADKTGRFFSARYIDYRRKV
jgi:hypothetical protein